MANAVAAVALRRAVRRWPAASRDDVTAEWSAELFEITHESGVVGWRRSWRAVAFSMSLAFARGLDNDASALWAEGKKMIRTIQKPAAALLLAPFLSLFTVALAGVLALVGSLLVMSAFAGSRDAPYEAESYAAGAAAVTVAALFVARALARRWRRIAWPVSPYVAVPVLLVAGFLPVGLLVSDERVADLATVAVAVCLATLTSPALVGLSRRMGGWTAMVATVAAAWILAVLLQAPLDLFVGNHLLQAGDAWRYLPQWLGTVIISPVYDLYLIEPGHGQASYFYGNDTPGRAIEQFILAVICMTFLVGLADGRRRRSTPTAGPVAGHAVAPT